MSERRPFLLERPGEPPLHGLVDAPPQAGQRPTVVICHGFKGFMEWAFFPPLAELLAARGYTAVRFNFSGTGMAPGDERVTDLAAFRDNTFSRELAEVEAVLAALGDTVAAGRVDRRRVALLGHSRGGSAALLAAAGEASRERLAALVTWAAVATFDRYDAATEEGWRRDGVLPVVNARTGQRLELGVGLLRDLEEHREALDLECAAARRRAPWLLVHGADDETVPVAEAHRLHDGAAAPKELLVVPGAGHTFGAVHPFAGPTPQLTAALNATQRWLRRHLG